MFGMDAEVLSIYRQKASPALASLTRPLRFAKGACHVLGEDVRCILNWMLSMP